MPKYKQKKVFFCLFLYIRFNLLETSFGDFIDKRFNQLTSIVSEEQFFYMLVCDSGKTLIEIYPKILLFIIPRKVLFAETNELTNQYKLLLICRTLVCFIYKDIALTVRAIFN